MFDPETSEALQVARGLVESGVPLFLARPVQPDDDAHWHKVGFVLPKGWQQTQPDPSVVDRWQPGYALCAVMGHTMDCLDVDPRSGGTLPANVMDDVNPSVLAGQTTPSGGFHLFVHPLGEGSRDGVYPGVDVKGGMPDGSGRGFAFIAPTVKISKASGEPASYRWQRVPDFTPRPRSEVLAAAVLAAKARSGKSSRFSDKPDTTNLTPELAAYAEQVTRGEPHSSQVADRVIAAKLAEVAHHQPATGTGFRTVLMRAAMTLGGYVGAGHLSADDAFDVLSCAVRDCWGSVDQDDYLWIEQGLRDGGDRPFSVYAAHDVSGPPGAETSDEAKWQFYDVIGRHPFDPDRDTSDQGLADQVLERAYPGLRASTDAGTYVVRGPEVWRESEDMAGWAVSVLARLMPVGAKAGADEEKGEAHWQFERRKIFTSSAGSGRVAKKIRDITRGADHFATVRLSELDTEAEVLWAGGVPWDLRASGEQPVVSHLDPGTPHLHAALCAPALVPTPAWDAFIASVWPDPEVRAWALRVLSISLAGYPDAALPILYGSERTGKSATISLIMRALGTYAHAADPRLLAGADNAHASVIYALKGRRLSFIDEGPRRGGLAAERLKQLTGGAPLTGNAMRANPVTFDPTHTLVMSTNDEPQIADAALRARMRIIPCEGDRDTVMATRGALTPAIWAEEAPGVLAALMRETAAWLGDRTSALTAAAPMAVITVADEIAEAQDVFAQWVFERTTPDDQGTASRALYTAFAAWHEDAPTRRRTAIPTETAWGRAMNRLGFPSIKRTMHNVRQLKISNGGDVSWVNNFPNGGSTSGDVDGGGGSEPKPTTPENGRSDPNSTVVVEGMDSKHSTIHYNNNTQDHKEKKVQVSGTGNRPSNSPAPPPEPLGPDAGARATNIAFMSRCPVCNDEPGVTTQGKIRAHKVNGVKCEGSGRVVPGFVTPAQAARAAKVTELAGEMLTLPAAMRRGEEPRSVSLEMAASILRMALERNGGALGVDIETNALPQWDPRYAVTSIQLGDWQEGVDLDADDEDHRDLANRFLSEALELNAHSYTADLAPLAKLGVITDYAAACAKTVDTATRAKLADPHLTGNGDGLKELSGTLLGDRAVSPAAEAAKDELGKAAGWIWKLKPDTPETKNGWLQIDKRCATMVRYAISDVLDCTAIRRVLPEPAPAVDERERLAQRVTAVVPLLGIKLDGEAVSEQLSAREPRAAEKLARINALGVDNPDSPKQVTERLTALGAALPRTESGNASGAGDVLEKLTAAPGELGELAQTILDYRGDATVLKNMIRPWARSTQGGDSRTYPTIYTLGADTGRMSCVRPNLQQVAREGGMRECLVADPGMKIIAADFSSVEVRVAAALSQDPTLMQFVHEGRDLHGEIAALVFGDGWTKAQRYSVKRIVFGRLYGGGLETLSRQAGLSDEVTQRCLDVLDAMTPGLKGWSEGLKTAIRGGMAEFPTYAGRVIHLDTSLPHKGPNFAIQGTARELLIDALVRWDAGPYAGGVILPVHDEVVAMVREEDADAAAAYLGECMTTSLYGVAITAEVDAPVDRWASAA
jgi:P4 family phage/plasmid primase-like protien